MEIQLIPFNQKQLTQKISQFYTQNYYAFKRAYPNKAYTPAQVLKRHPISEPSLRFVASHLKTDFLIT